jgi:hypothetical protein
MVETSRRRDNRSKSPLNGLHVIDLVHVGYRVYTVAGDGARQMPVVLGGTLR